MGPINPRLRKFAAVPLLALAAGAAVYFYVNRSKPTLEVLLDHLPAGEGITGWIDVAALRSGGVLDLIAGYKPVEDKEYQAFVEQSGFDYRKNLDGVLITVRGDDVLLLLTGRFPWSRLEAYVKSHGGSCEKDVCRMAGSQPGRNISFSPVRNSVMALAVSPDQSAVTAILKRKDQLRTVASRRPVWVTVPPSSLRNRPAMPAGARPFTSALAKAESVTLSLGPEAGRFEALLDVTCPTPGDAAFLQLQLQEATILLKSLIARENKQANPADLSGVLTSGTFGRNDRQVWGRWPIERSFVQALAGGTL
jgi:hypothetical protein